MRRTVKVWKLKAIVLGYIVIGLLTLGLVDETLQAKHYEPLDGFGYALHVIWWPISIASASSRHNKGE
jgi:hypothetical protein